MTTQNQEYQMTDYKAGEAARRRYKAILGAIQLSSQAEMAREPGQHTIIHVDDLIERPEFTDVDNVVGIIDLHSKEQVEAIVEKTWECLKPGGLVTLDFPDFSKTQGFPMSYALDEFVEYISKHQEAMGFPLNTIGIRSFIPEERFEHVDVQAFVPRFLEADQRILPALVLESLCPFFEEKGLGSRLELDAIISELRHLCMQPHMMISGPMILHMTAQKGH